MDSSSIHRRAIAVTAFLVVAFGALAARIVYVQAARHEYYAEKARAERLERQNLPGARGEIFDRHGEALVQNQHVVDLIADHVHLTDIHVCRRAVAYAEGLRVRQVADMFTQDEVKSRFLDLAEATLTELVGEEAAIVRAAAAGQEGKVRFVVTKALEFDRAEVIRRTLRDRRIGGFRFEESMRRYYPNPGRLVQVLGYTNADYVGCEGIERSLDDHLAGKDGYRLVESTRRSSELDSEHSVEVLPTHGADVELTIDMGLQNIVEGVLERAVGEFAPEKIMAVFIDPLTGEILAMASRPHFDQATREGIRKIHPISDRYEPGSTFKIVTLAAGYDQGLITPDTTFFCYNGRYNEGRSLVVNDHHPYASLSTEQILAKSSNIGAYLIAKQVGRHTFYSYMRDFGFGTRTGICLTGEAAGSVAKPDTGLWSATSLSRVAMGYEVDVTPLQMANALCAIANGGNLMKPQIIRRVTASSGETVYQFSPRKIRRVVSEQAADYVRQAMVAVVEGGTGKRAAIDGFLVAGKTGTAYKPKEDRSKGYYHGRYVVSFAGFLPAENPSLAGIIVVDDPQNQGSRYGGTVAAPMFAEIAAAAMPYLGVKPTVVPRKAARALPGTAAVGAARY